MNMNISASRLTATLGLGFVLGAVQTSCVRESTFINENHCTASDGNAVCTERYGAERSYCVLGPCGPTMGQDGCVAEPPTDAECYSPCGGNMNVMQDDSCIMGGEESTGSSSGDGDSTTNGEGETETDESTTTGPMPCVGHEECDDPAAPLCDPDVGECVSCDLWTDANGDAACAEVDPMAPLCVGAECVACDAEGDTSVCDAQLLICGDDNACGPCSEHGQCDSGACDIAVGTCFDPISVLDVGMGQTYTSIAAALGDVATMKLDSAVLRLHEGASFDETAAVMSGALAFVAAEGQSPQWANLSVMAPTLTVSGADTRVYVEGVRLAQNGNDVGLLVDGATVDVQRSRIVQNSGGGVVADNGAELTLENCFVGGSVNNVPAIAVNGATGRFVYTTVGAGFGAASALSCESPISVEVRNSVLVAETDNPEVACAGVVISDSATETELSDLDTGWFTNYAAGDFHLTGIAPDGLGNAAEWQDGDPPTDIDGDARPATNGSPDYAGADIP